MYSARGRTTGEEQQVKNNKGRMRRGGKDGEAEIRRQIKSALG